MAECDHGEVRDDVCECDRLWRGENCDESMRDACGPAYSIAQAVYFVVYAAFLWQMVLQQLSISRLSSIQYSTMLLLIFTVASRLLWLVDPYALTGEMDSATSLLLSNTSNLFLLLAFTSTMAYWRQLLLSSSSSDVLHLFSFVIGSWLVLSAATSLLLVHGHVTQQEWAIDAQVTILTLFSLSQLIALLVARRRLRRYVDRLSVTETAQTSRVVWMLTRLLNHWTLAAVSYSVLTLTGVLFVALEVDQHPWPFFVVVFVVMRLSLLSLMLVLFTATAATPVPRAHAIIRGALKLMCLWTPLKKEFSSAEPSPRTTPVGMASPAGGRTVHPAPLSTNQTSDPAAGLAATEELRQAYSPAGANGTAKMSSSGHRNV